MKPWTFTDKCMSCGSTVTLDNTKGGYATSAEVAFKQRNKFGMIPNFVKDGECVCGKKYAVGFFRKERQYIVGLLIEKEYLDKEVPKPAPKVDEIPPAHSSRPAVMIGYTEDEMEMAIPPEIQMMSKKDLLAHASLLKIPTAKLAVDVELIKRMVAIEKERAEIAKQKMKLKYLARKERERVRREAGLAPDPDDTDGEDLEESPEDADGENTADIQQ